MDRTKAIGFQIKELSHMIKRSIDQQVAQLDIEDITGVQAWIIGYIYRQGEGVDVFPRDIEREFHIRRSSVAETLSLMEKKGLIVKESVAHDARLKKVVLTPKARGIQEKIIHQIDEMEAQLTRGLSKGEMMILFEILEKVKQNASDFTASVKKGVGVISSEDINVRK